MLANRVRKNFRKLHPRFERENIGAFRLYDRDIPEIRAAVDWYEGHLVIAEYQREHDYPFRFGTEASLNLAQHEDLMGYLDTMGTLVNEGANALDAAASVGARRISRTWPTG